MILYHFDPVYTNIIIESVAENGHINLVKLILDKVLDINTYDRAIINAKNVRFWML